MGLSGFTKRYYILKLKLKRGDEDSIFLKAKTRKKDIIFFYCSKNKLKLSTTPIRHHSV